MSGSNLSSVYQIGPRVSAQVLGLPFDQYRPTADGAAIASGNHLGVMQAWITADAALKGNRPFEYGKPRGYAALDPAIAQVGDYLVGSLTSGGVEETFFIASMDLPAPIQVIRCNQVLSFTRPSTPTPGPGYYGGDTTTGATPLVTGWPAAVTQGTKGNDGDAKLPSDPRLPWVQILVPAAAGVQFRFSDFATDAQTSPMRYEVSSAELTALGWRLTAALTVT